MQKKTNMSTVRRRSSRLARKRAAEEEDEQLIPKKSRFAFCKHWKTNMRRKELALDVQKCAALFFNRKLDRLVSVGDIDSIPTRKKSFGFRAFDSGLENHDTYAYVLVFVCCDGMWSRRFCNFSYPITSLERLFKAGKQTDMDSLLSHFEQTHKEYDHSFISQPYEPWIYLLKY